MADTRVRMTVEGKHSNGEMEPLWGLVNYLLLGAFSADQSAAIGNGTTFGFLRTTVAAQFRIANVITALSPLVSIDDLWDLSGETDTTATEFRSYWLYNDGTFDSGLTGLTETAALLNLPEIDLTLSIIGVYTAGQSTDFTTALASQGTITNGIPSGVPNVGVLAPHQLVSP